ncbi:MAG: T6SS component TssC (ImpC/VipB), partial [Olavius algarvensis Gamma 1 endosymbiont]
AELVEQVDQSVCGAQPRDRLGGGQGAQAPGGGRGNGRRGRGQPRLLHIQVLSATPLPARGPHGLPTAGLQAAVAEDM